MLKRHAFLVPQWALSPSLSRALFSPPPVSSCCLFLVGLVSCPPHTKREAAVGLSRCAVKYKYKMTHHPSAFPCHMTHTAGWNEVLHRPPPLLLLQSVRLPIRPLFRHTVRQEMRWGDCVHSCVCAQVRYQMCSKWMLIWRLCINKIWVRLKRLIFAIPSVILK